MTTKEAIQRLEDMQECVKEEIRLGDDNLWIEDWLKDFQALGIAITVMEKQEEKTMPKFELVRMDFAKDGLLEYVQGHGIADDYVRAYAEASRILNDIGFGSGKSERAITLPEDLKGETGFYVELLEDGTRTGHCVYCLKLKILGPEGEVFLENE